MLYKAFREYCKKNKLNQSQAMERILSDFLLKKEKICSIADNHQDKIKDLEYRVSEIEKLIKTKDYLEKEKINKNSIKVNNQDIKKL